jgi:hypothetical protein
VPVNKNKSGILLKPHWFGPHLLGSDLYWGLGVKTKERGSVANVAVEGGGSPMVVTMNRFLKILIWFIK